MMLKQLLRKVILGHRHSSQSYVSYLRKKGCSIGDNVIIFSPFTTTIDETRPFLLRIGDNVKITTGVTILTHDFSYSVCRSVFHDLVNDRSQETVIGNNVFIGMNAVILPGAVIGNNCIIGAGAIVLGHYDNNVVIAGNPARVVSTLSDYYEKRKASRIYDAFSLVQLSHQKYNRDPSVKEMGNYYWIFAPRDPNWLVQNGIDISMSGDDESLIIEDFLNSVPLFNGFEDFLEAAHTWELKQ